ncbi:dendritic cell-specific transmembrane protein isoform X1 [Daphnia magna]|uniref:dendritic cell-specific transmembrane protein isoform X1 n=1 Tax=Daphnia magna TaxID=35525 RepID=UPI001E1BA279|nr:dendritic cell-specific transmembrane protein isoform X1 [Daphnia magna]
MEEPPKSPFSLVVIPETKDEPLKSPSLSVPSETMSKWPSLRGLVNDWQDLLGPTNENSEDPEDFDWSVSYFKSTNSKCFSRFLYSDTNKFRNIKLILILIVGILYGLLAMAILHFSFSFHLWIASAMALTVAVAVTLLLIFSYDSRCIFSLVVPSLGTRQGKTILIALLVTQLIAGPLGNLTYNMKQSSQSLSCYSNMTVNQTQAIKEGIKMSIHNFKQNFSVHHLNQVKEGTEAVTSIGEEISSIWCQIFRCAVAAKIKQKAKQTVKDAVSFDQVKNHINNVNQTINQAKLQLHTTHNNVKNEVRTQIGKFFNVVSFLKLATIFSLLYLLFSCWLYYHRFLNILSYDNVYATELLKRYDRHRCERGSPPLFPLHLREKAKIIDSVSLSMSPIERKAFFISLILYLVHCVFTVILYVADWTLYTFMDIVVRNVNQSSGWNETATFRVDSVNFELAIPFFFDAKQCLAIPRKISNDSIIVLVVVYIILALAVLSQAYCLRFRHSIVAYFYPERNSERIQYLYNKLLKKRKRPKITLTFRAPSRGQSIANMGKILAEKEASVKKRTFLGLAKTLHLFRRYCAVCGFPETAEFKKCANHNCCSVYCSSCFDDMNSVCFICQN